VRDRKRSKRGLYLKGARLPCREPPFAAEKEFPEGERGKGVAILEREAKAPPDILIHTPEGRGRSLFRG